MTLLALLAGHALAAWGVWRGSPPALWGDEQRHLQQVLHTALQVVWAPWAALSADAAFPAPFARYVIPAAVAWLAGEGLVAVLAEQVRRRVMVRSGGHAIVAGLGPVGEALAAQWRRTGRPVLVLSPREEDRATALRMGAAFVLGDGLDARAFARAGLADAGFLACVGDDDIRNVDLAAAALAWSAGVRDAGRALLQCCVAVSSPYHRVALAPRLHSLGATPVADVQVFSPPQIAVRKLLRERPAEAFRFVDGPAPVLWVFGTGATAEELVLALLRQGCWSHGQQAQVVVIDRQAEAWRGAFLDRWGPGGRASAVRFIAAGAEQGERLFASLPADVAHPTALYFCGPADATNVADAMTVCTAFESTRRAVPPLYLLQQEPGASAATLASHPWLVPFGGAASVAAELLEGERLDAMARTIHERYVGDALAGGEALGGRRSLQHWADLPQDLKDDNRYATDHHFTKVVETACVLHPAHGEEPAFAWDESEVEGLARAEHDRWVVQRQLAGWRHGEVRDDARRVHPDMVSWEALAEPRRELDRAVVRQVPALFASQGLQVRREHALHVQGPRTPWAFTPAFEAAADALGRRLAMQHRGEAVRLWLEPSSAMACRVAESWVCGDGLLGVVLREPVAQLLARTAAGANRQRLLVLLARADRMLCAGQGAPARPLARTCSRLLLSIDASDLQPQPGDWALDAEGQLIAAPDGPTTGGEP